SPGRATREAAWLPSGTHNGARSPELRPQGLIVSPVEFPADHIDRPERGDHVRYHVPSEDFGQGRHNRKAGRTDPHPVCAPSSVAHHVEPKLPVSPFYRKVHLPLGRTHAVAEHDQLELLHEPFDV